MRIRNTFFLLLLALATCAGCGEADRQNRLPVAGTVTFNGSPLSRGSIRFEPQDEPKAIVSGAMIVQGTYAIPKDRGLPPGKYLVCIHAAASAAQSSPDAAPGPNTAASARELIPPEFNVKSTQVVEVQTGKNEFTFNITGK